MSTPLPPNAHIAIVGGGIIGVSAAFALLERGFRITLYERHAPGLKGPSYGNAGHVVGSAIFPLATPGIGVQGLAMLRDPDGPLKIPTQYMPKLASWLWRFWRSSYGDAYERSIAALTALNAGVIEDMEALYARAGIGGMLKRDPALYLYESDSSFRAAKADWSRREGAGLKSTVLSKAEVQDLEPELAPIFTHGVLSHEWAIVSDPYAVTAALFEAATARGLLYENRDVLALEPIGDKVRLRLEGGAAEVDGVLVAAGVWSPPLAKSLGEALPVEAERGYNLTFPGEGARIRRPMVFADRGVVATALEPGLRIGGWTELGGTELPPNPQRWAKMREISAAIVPAVAKVEAKEWMGHRPSVPDSVPILSRSGKHPRVFYAVGHGHYGLSQSAKSARIMTEIIADAADRTYAAHSVKRFN